MSPTNRPILVAGQWIETADKYTAKSLRYNRRRILVVAALILGSRGLEFDFDLFFSFCIPGDIPKHSVS